MSRLIQIGAGIGAVAIAVILGVALLPQLQEAAHAGKQAVAKPVFVPAAAALASPAPAPNEPAKEAALVKLAEALSAAPVAAAPTRSLTYAPLDTPRPTPFAATVAAPSATAAAAPVSEEARQHCAQGLVALANGDIGASRALLMRAADEGDARALMALGETWEPATLAGLGAVGAKGDPARARDYYNKALAAGVGAARGRLAALESN